MKRTRFPALILAAVAVLAAPAFAAVITVHGTNTYPYDVAQVQAAVSNPFTKVILSGTFNFGEDGSVVITVPGVTIQGAASGATIVGGDNPLKTLHTELGDYPPAQTSGAKNLTIRNLRLEGWREFAIYVIGVPAEDNFTLIENNTLVNTLDWTTDYTYGIHYCHSSGSAVIRNNTVTNVRGYGISTDGLLLHANDSYKVYGNRIEECHYIGISICISDPTGLDPNLPKNEGPVTIENNIIHLSADQTYAPWSIGIDLGTVWLMGTSHALVKGNVITCPSPCYDGIVLGWYGDHRSVIGNDLTGLTTWDPQIIDVGDSDLIMGNSFGPVDFKTAVDMGDPYGAAAISLFSQSPWPGVYPDPAPTSHIVVVGNDYRRTGLRGWKFDEAGNVTGTGCVIMASAIDLYGAEGSDVTENSILEIGRFPRGTGADSQVLELPVHAYGNFILGQGFDFGAQFRPLNSAVSMKAVQSGANLSGSAKGRPAALQGSIKPCKKR